MTEIHKARPCWKCGALNMAQKAHCAMTKMTECAKYPVFYYQDAVRRIMPGVARLYCDMDGVLADFERHFESLFARKREPHEGWDMVREQAPTFYRDMPPMVDMMELWSAIAPLKPILLSGSPPTVPTSSNHKVDWKNIHLPDGERVPIICCRTKDKSLYCRPGDTLIDDHTDPQYQVMWEKAGGVWVSHTSARSTIAKLRALGILP